MEIRFEPIKFSVSRWGSIIGHEMNHIQYLADNFKYKSSGADLRWDETRAYQWQISQNDFFGNPFTIKYLQNAKKEYGE